MSTDIPLKELRKRLLEEVEENYAFRLARHRAPRKLKEIVQEFAVLYVAAGIPLNEISKKLKDDTKDIRDKISSEEIERSLDQKYKDSLLSSKGRYGRYKQIRDNLDKNEISPIGTLISGYVADKRTARVIPPVRTELNRIGIFGTANVVGYQSPALSRTAGIISGLVHVASGMPPLAEPWFLHFSNLASVSGLKHDTNTRPLAEGRDVKISGQVLQSIDIAMTSSAHYEQASGTAHFGGVWLDGPESGFGQGIFTQSPEKTKKASFGRDKIVLPGQMNKVEQQLPPPVYVSGTPVTTTTSGQVTSGYFYSLLDGNNKSSFWT